MNNVIKVYIQADGKIQINYNGKDVFLDPSTLQKVLEKPLNELSNLHLPNWYKFEILEFTQFLATRKDVEWNIILAYFESNELKYKKLRCKNFKIYDYGRKFGIVCDDTAVLCDCLTRICK